MKDRVLVFVFCVISLYLSDNALASAPSRNEVVKLFTDANEKHLQSAKLIAANNNQEASQKLDEAALQYETLLTHGFKNGQVYYNLANTYYRQGERGKAIVNYRRAQRLMPRNAEIDTNLRLVKNSTEDKELSQETPKAIQRIFFWFFLLNPNELAIVAISMYVVFMILLCLRIILKYPWLGKIIAGFSAGLFIAVVSLGIKLHEEHGVNHGVIVTEKCQVLYGPGEEYEPKFEIHSGTECIIEDEKDGWYRVYVNIGVKQDTGSKIGVEEKVSNDIRRGWLQKKYVDII